MLQGESEDHLGAVLAIAIEIGRGPCLVHFGYRGCFEDHQKYYAEDKGRLRTTMIALVATRVGCMRNTRLT